MLAALLAVVVAAAPASSGETISRYREAYFETFPSRATEAGRHDFDNRLEDLSRPRLARWISLNRETVARLSSALASGSLSSDDRLDAELTLRHAEWEVHELAVRHRPERDPLFWTGVAGNATVFLLVRNDRPLAERLSAALARMVQIPRLARQAQEALSSTSPALLSPELCRIAARQARASAGFAREGFSALFASETKARASAAADSAAQALDRLALFLEELAGRASGSPRLGNDYAEAFRIATSEKDLPSSVAEQAVAALADKRREAADYGRSVWSEIFPGQEAPAEEKALLARLFSRVAADRAKDTDEFVADYKKQVSDLDAFLHAREVVSLPDPLTLTTDRSPAFFVGQSVGGVYPAGPYAPDAQTLWYLPTPSDSATPEERDGFFRDFNHHFNVMITPHEILPGHYLQLKVAAHQQRKVRALFPDGVYVEGWGTFCERLILDTGWGGPLDRLAHLKKQMENIARTIVDIRVHTSQMPRQEVIRFVKEEALQDDQFASNMWTRAITSPTQMTTYYLGYRQIFRLYEEMKAARGPAFRLKDFMDRMLSLGPVPVSHYRELLLSNR
ncbi:MAG TPA: DUF885 domain-containing protein [Thermoanaerobaculia bacterium]|nr:DUF885 domain-containing protein [Thermoanaerobaculia bacterium]